LVVQVLAMYRLRSRQVNEIPKEGLYGVETVPSAEMSVSVDDGRRNEVTLKLDDWELCTCTWQRYRKSKSTRGTVKTRKVSEMQKNVE
jgi:predicted flavoprotein YhiN